MAASAYAQTPALTWTVEDTQTSGAIDIDTELYDDDVITATTANYASPVGQPEDDDEEVIEGGVELGDYTFEYCVHLRVGTAPSSSLPTGEAQDGYDGMALVIEAKQNIDITIYYRRGSSKSLDCYNQTLDETVGGTETVYSATAKGNLYASKVFQLVGGNTYTFYTKSGTTELYAFDLSESTYVEPTEIVYSGKTAATEDGYSTVTYADGAKLVLGTSGKTYGTSSAITIEGATYTSIKGSNGAQNKFYAPEGKKIYRLTLYSFVNAAEDASIKAYWKEVNGVAYDEESANLMKSFKDGANPDVSSYDFPDGLESVTFNNAGKQLCFVLVMKYAPETPADEPAEEEKDPTSIESAEAGAPVSVEYYNVAGARVDGLQPGINIVRTTYEGGKVVTSKVRR